MPDLPPYQMTTQPPAHSLHVVYISRLAPEADYRAFAEISRGARARNATLGVGGVLLFDGDRFCQWIYGEPGTVEALMTAISLDTRHVELEVLHHRLIEANENECSWCCGFVAPDALDALNRGGAGRSDVMDTLMAMLATADLEPLVQFTRLSPHPAEPCCNGP